MRFETILFFFSLEMPAASYTIQTSEDAIFVQLEGDWNLRDNRPDADEVIEKLQADDLRPELTWVVSGENLGEWDSSLMMTLAKIHQAADRQHRGMELRFMPEGVLRLLDLAKAVPEAQLDKDNPAIRGDLRRIGIWTLNKWGGLERYADFLGQLILETGKLVCGKSSFRGRDLLAQLQQSGPQALPIVSLLSFLTGLIIAFISIIQLQKFAADIYVADLVGLVMTRELAAVMTGVIMAGRTGAAYAAQLGSMKVNEEIDALKTFGISPMAFLVLPRVVALVVMMPLLCILADIISIFGGMVVSVSVSDLSVKAYLIETQRAVSMTDVSVGVFKAGIFGIIIAIAGCYRGLNCGKDAASVGNATTSAVVTAITWIVIVDAVFAVLFHVLGI